MNGLLIYNKIDFNRNEAYIQWLQSEAALKGMNLKLMFEDEFFKTGLDVNPDQIQFVVNRTRNYDLSLMFELNGIRVFNNAQITLIGNNKLAGYKRALELGIAFSDICLRWDGEDNVLSKPNYGHGGYGIALLEHLETGTGCDRIQQRYVKNAIGDVRFYILNNQVIHAVLRKSSNSLVSNYSQGGDIELFPYTQDHLDLVNRYLAGLTVDYAGIDFIVTEQGELLFNEMEDVVGSRMLSALGINDTTEGFLEHIRTQLSSAG